MYPRGKAMRPAWLTPWTVSPRAVGPLGEQRDEPQHRCGESDGVRLGDRDTVSWDRGAALTSTLHWFETDLLTRAENLVGLTAVNRELLARAALATRADRVVLDMDSSESPVHGAQEGSAYNGHFATVCYHPLFLFNEQGDCLAASLRPGHVPRGTPGRRPTTSSRDGARPGTDSGPRRGSRRTVADGPAT